jgi:agmatine deiminase
VTPNDASPASGGATPAAAAEAAPGTTGSRTLASRATPVAEAAGWRVPADFEPARAIWIGWDEGHRDFSMALARSIAPHARVEVVARDPQALEAARQALAPLAGSPAGGGPAVTAPAAPTGAPRPGIGFHLIPEALYFVRDGVVFTTGPQRELGVVDFAWNDYGRPGWCRVRHPGPAEAEAARACEGDSARAQQHFDLALARQLGARVFRSPLVAEGGGVESNGQGLMIANEALVRQRHPDADFAELQRLYLQLPGVRKVIWLPAGLAQDPPLRATIVGQHVAWGTGGHTDEFVRFADARTVLLAWPEDDEAARHPVARLNRVRMQRNFEILSRATDLEGRPLRVLKLPLPRIVERRVFLSAASDPGWSQQWSAAWFPAREGRREGDPVMQVAITSTLNFVVANSLVLVPGYLEHGTPRALHERMLRVLEQAFPGRTIGFIDAIGANWVGGGPHCATLNEPRVA